MRYKSLQPWPDLCQMWRLRFPDFNIAKLIQILEVRGRISWVTLKYDSRAISC